MTRVYNFELAACRLFWELTQCLLSSIRLESICFLKYVSKVITKDLILKKHVILTCGWKFHHAHELCWDPKAY